MNPIYVSTAVQWMGQILFWLVLAPAVIVLIAAGIPAPRRPRRYYDRRAGRSGTTGSVLFDRPDLDRPVRTDVVIDPAARARRVNRAAQAQVRRREGLRRQLAAAEDAAAAAAAFAAGIRKQLDAHDEAAEPAGGAR